MAYISRGNKPNEYASKSNHSHIINDKEVQNFLSKCKLPKERDDIDMSNGLIEEVENPIKNPIKYLITVDGGYTEVEVKKSFPSSKITFFQFGAFWLNLEDWSNLEEKPFISPEDMSTYRDLERIKFVFPTKQVNYKDEPTFIDSVRRAIYDFFMEKHDSESSFMETLKWLIYEEYDKNSTAKSYDLKNPNPNKDDTLELDRDKMRSDYTFKSGNDTIYLTDIFRIHEGVDEELGAGGMVGYLATVIEQIIIIHYIKYAFENFPTFLKSTMFIKDGSLAFFGQTARVHRKMRKLINYVQQSHNLFLIGLEKTGNFADHADEITKVIKGKSKLEKGKILLMSNKYIYQNIIPGDANKTIYGETSYYSNKVIYHSKSGNVFVAAIPVKSKEVIKSPEKSDFKNLDVMLYNLDLLKCDMYDNSLVPIALVNKLVSLANHPSQVLLGKFARKTVKR